MSLTVGLLTFDTAILRTLALNKAQTAGFLANSAWEICDFSKCHSVRGTVASFCGRTPQLPTRLEERKRGGGPLSKVSLARGDSIDVLREEQTAGLRTRQHLLSEQM
jgi:hypothetical protein